MSSHNEIDPAAAGDVHDDVEHDGNYQPPPQKTIEEIMAADQEDESLRRYKEALLGAAQSEKIVVGKKILRLERNAGSDKGLVFVTKLIFLAPSIYLNVIKNNFPDTNDPRKVIVKKLSLCVDGRDDMELDLTGDLTQLKKQVIT